MDIFLLAKALQRPYKNKLKFESGILKATGLCRHIFLAMKKSRYYVRDLKLSSCEDMLIEPRRMPLGMTSILIDLMRFATTKGHFW